MSTAQIRQINLQVMWDRLIAVAEEQAQSLIRSAFSVTTREAADVSAGVFDLQGRMIAEAITGTPGHVNSMAMSVGHFLKKFPLDSMRDGDVYVTNDPWLGTGHLPDLTVVTPAYKNGAIVALFACTSHLVDIGGRGLTVECREIFEEGLRLPILRLIEAGEMQEAVRDIICANVRDPTAVLGDIYSLAACNDTGSARLVAMMDEFDIDDLQGLANHIIERSRRGSLDIISQIPSGSYKNTMDIDGFDDPIRLSVTVTVGSDGVDIDFSGSSGQSEYAINSPMCYTEAYASFGAKCLIYPHIPNNAGSLSVVRVTAPRNTIVNAIDPAPVGLRHIVGQMLPDVVMGALHQAVADWAPAEGASAIWPLFLMGGPGRVPGPHKLPADAVRFSALSIHAGGSGARPFMDGLSATAFPSGVRNVPIEVTEAMYPLVCWRKEYLVDSGGAGATRGGLGQFMEIGHLDQHTPFAFSGVYDRVDHPARGREGGCDGGAGAVLLRSGARLKSKGAQAVPAGDRLVLKMPGGGGLGDPLTRDVSKVLEDVVNGLVSRGSADKLYGVIIGDDGLLDQHATDLRRDRAKPGEAVAEPLA